MFETHVLEVHRKDRINTTGYTAISVSNLRLLLSESCSLFSAKKAAGGRFINERSESEKTAKKCEVLHDSK